MYIEHGVQCANDIITVIKDFPIESNIDGIKETEYIAQLDGMHTKCDRSHNNKENAFLITLPSLFDDID